MSEKLVIPRERYLEDLSRGYCTLEWVTRRTKTVKDLRTGNIVTVQRAPTVFYRCMECQFDNMSLEIMQKHLANGVHPWNYGDGGTPYGPMYLVDLPDLEVDNKEPGG